MRGERSGRLVLGVYDGGHKGPADFVGDVEPPENQQPASRTSRRLLWRCGREKQQPEHYCLIRNVGLYRHHGRAAAFLAINIK
ncbi:hypothetical protein TNCV_3907891 [Trichonephila clavipes]|nr:hypothetical protein TNCV_3907891 [Trichonephila clavipes]